jgi:hypothetical protein
VRNAMNDSVDGRGERIRGVFLLLAFVLVGGMGCVSAMVGETDHSRRVAYEASVARMQTLETARQRRVAALEPAARLGDPVAMTALAYAKLMAPGRQPDIDREAIDLLSAASARGHGQAQAMLGQLLATGQGDYRHVPRVSGTSRDRDSGIALLQQAASQACRYGASGDPGSSAYVEGSPASIEPALLLGDVLARSGRETEAWLWEARAAVHCGQVPKALHGRMTGFVDPRPQARTVARALLILGGRPDSLAWYRKEWSAEESAAAEREATELRRQVAASEREYPAPPGKVKP